jgi:NAD(P)-dependent dehydrogenase (short-subunit alcohol dehydrogenase family)
MRMLKDKVIIVTGSSRGIGAAVAKEFGDQEAKVVVHYLNQKIQAEKVIQSITSDSLLVQADLTNENDIKRMVDEVINKYGQIDVLVNNAGAIIRPGDWQTNIEIWNKTIATNLTSAWLMTKHVAPKMKKGSIINVVSVYGDLGAAPVAAYTSAKGGLITLTKSMAKELAPHIRVNAVSPSNVMTDMTKGAGEELINYFIEQTPLKRIANPEELAKPIVFLASDDASYITGEILVVDGGYSLR